MNIRAAGLVAALALAILPLGAQAQQSTFNTGPARVEYTQQVATSFYVPMRDGTRIAISLHRPSVNGVPVETPLPVIWHHALPHGASPNHTDRPRLAQYITMYPPDWVAHPDWR